MNDERLKQLLVDYKDWFGKSSDELKQMICNNKSWIQLNLKRKRNRKKFEKNWLKYISKHIRNKYLSVLFAKPIANPIYRRHNYIELARKLVVVEKMNLPTGIIYNNDI